MPLEIRELVVRGVIASADRPAPEVPVSSQAVPEELVEEVVARVLERLRDLEER